MHGIRAADRVSRRVTLKMDGRLAPDQPPDPGGRLLLVVLVKKALLRYDGNVKRTARALGLSRGGLYRRLEKHGLGDGG